MEKVSLKIDGMSCGHCVSAVRKALEEVEGVTVQDVAVGTATVEFDPSRASLSAITGAVEDAGYDATPAA